MLFKIKFQACGASPPAAVLEALSCPCVPGNEFCHTATPAAEGEDVCIIQDMRYSKESMFQHVSGCSCFIYMNNDFRRPSTTIRFKICQDYNATFRCFWVSTMHFD
jgi:hypothetical protein